METPQQSNSEISPSDRDLLNLFMIGRDEAAFRLLVARHGGLVWCVCQRMLPCQQDREDVFQATFLKLLIQADRRAWRESLGGWLHRVAFLLSLKSRAARKREQPFNAAAEPWGMDSCLEDIQRQDVERALHEEVARLPRRDRDAIVLHYFLNKSQEEAAAEMGCSLSALKSLLQRGRRKLYLRLGCRGLGCSLALLTLEGTTSAATPVLSQVIDKTVVTGLTYQASGGPASVSPEIKSLAQGNPLSMFQSPLATYLLTTLGCYGVVLLGSVGWLPSGVSPARSTASLVAWQNHLNPELAQPFPLLMQETKEVTTPSTDARSGGGSSPTKATDEDIAKLIEQLTDSDPALRQLAVKRLNQMGIAAKAQIQAAAAGKNKALARQAELVLLNILRQERVTGRQAAWERFKKIAGDTEEARLLFNKMYEANEPLLVSHSDGDANVAVLFKECCLRQLEVIDQKSPPLTDAMVSLWILGGLKQVPKDFSEAIYSVFFATNAYDEKPVECRTIPKHIKNLPEDGLEKKVLLQLIREWLSKSLEEGSDADKEFAMLVKLAIASEMEMKEEHFALSTQFLRQKRRAIEKSTSPWPADYFQYMASLLTVCQMGDRSHIGLVEPFLKNSTEVFTSKNGVGTQVCDIALPVAIYLSGQPPAEYGLEAIDLNKGKDGYQSAIDAGYIFSDTEARKAAFSKWNAWVKANPIEKAEPPTN